MISVLRCDEQEKPADHIKSSDNYYEGTTQEEDAENLSGALRASLCAKKNCL